MVFVRPFAPPCPSAASALVPHSFMSHAFSPPDILLILGELRAEVRQLGQDLTYLRALVEERLPAPCVPVPRAASPSAQPQLAVPSVPVPRAAASSVPVPREGSCAPVPRASAASAPVPRAPSSAGSFSVVGSQAGSTCAPVPRAPAVNSQPVFDQEAEPVFHSPGAASSSAAGLDSPESYASTGLNVEASVTPPRSAIGSDQRERTLAGVRQHRRFLCAGPGWGSSGFQREASQSCGFSILLGGQGLQEKYLQSSAPFPHVRRGRARRESERHPGRLRLLRSPFLVGGSPGGF